MYKLLNMSDFSSLEEIEKNMNFYRERYNFDGFEIIKFTDKNLKELKDNIKGYHLRFFPCWLDLYRENYKKLYEELKEDKYIKSLCGGLSKKELIDYHKKELEIAKELEVEYIVFHPCNIYIKESFHYNFYYSNKEVLKEVVNFLNEILDDNKYNFTLLLENLWWSGLRLDSYEDADFLMKNIKYKNKGFLLDTGHMFNNNQDIKTIEEGIKYIEENITNLKEYKDYIYGVHLNFSISGDYVKSVSKNYDNNKSFEELMNEVYFHIQKIDYHDAFNDEKIVEILNKLPLKYLIYEFIATDSKELILKIETQDKAINKFLKSKK